MNKIPVLHIITRLIVGGAQENTMLTAALLDSDRYRVDIVSPSNQRSCARSTRSKTSWPWSA